MSGKSFPFRSHSNPHFAIRNRRQASKLSRRRTLRAELLEDRRLLTVAPTDIEITSTTIIENTKPGIVGELSAVDSNSAVADLQYTINGTGSDDASFQIGSVPRGGVQVPTLQFQFVPDFETPVDI